MVFRKKKKNKEAEEKIEKAVVKPINKADNYKLVIYSLK